MIFKWVKGRQGTKYEKLPLIQNKKFDLYLLRFPEGTHVPPHKDPIKNHKHYRLNITLVKPNIGGKFLGGNPIINLSRLTFFRPDLYTHEMSVIQSGQCYMLSFGFAI